MNTVNRSQRAILLFRGGGGVRLILQTSRKKSFYFLSLIFIFYLPTALSKRQTKIFDSHEKFFNSNCATVVYFVPIKSKNSGIRGD